VRLTLLGATGSIGASTVDVMLRHPGLLTAYALVGHANVPRMQELAELLHPEWVIMTDEAAAGKLKGRLPAGTHLGAGMQAAIAAVRAEETETVIAAMVGSAGLPATLAAVQAGKRVCLANKESLVMAGRIVMHTAKEAGAEIVPLDSEHVGVSQCLAGHDRGSVEQIILTASGGPFRERDLSSLQDIRPEEAVAHPNWDMGAKISVDSATMMNKALELIEARWLFDIPSEKLAVVIHPQSIIHALVCYRDGSVMAQMAEPDMRVPIAYALQTRPRLDSGTARLDLTKHGRLDFFSLDLERFPAMKLVRVVMKGQDSLAIAFNAANEVANKAFLEHRLPFTGIVPLVEEVLSSTDNTVAADLDSVFSIDAEARQMARRIVEESPPSKWRIV
jgi:1-deoxy-D-xylulose-5-phosphate reductoisomerase